MSKALVLSKKMANIAKFQREHSPILLTFIKLPVVIKTYVLSIFEWTLYTGFTVYLKSSFAIILPRMLKLFVLLFNSFYMCIPICVLVYLPHGAMGWSVICDFPGQTHPFLAHLSHKIVMQ